MAGRRGAECRDAQGTYEPAHVEDVRLDHIDGWHRDHPLPVVHVPVLLAARDVERERLAHLPRLLELPVRAGLLEVADAVFLEQPSDVDRPRRSVAGVGIHEQRHVGPECLAHGRDDCFRAPGPFVPVMAALGADSELERVEAELAAQAQHPCRFIPGAMSRRIEDAYARRLPALPPSSAVTGLPSRRARQSQSAVSSPASAR
jgi:hypothetical protein